MAPKKRTRKTTKKEKVTKPIEEKKEEVEQKPEVESKPMEPEPDPQPTLEDPDELIERGLRLKKERHMADELSKFNAIKCENDGTKLAVDVTRHMKPGIIGSEIVCPTCERVTQITSNYPGPVEDSSCTLETRLLGYVWLERHPQELTDDQLKKLVKYHADQVKHGDSPFPAREQVLLRAINLVLNKEGE